jgi:CspA family cold shock protein
MYPETRYAGVIKRFSGERGYGFIKPKDGSEDLFFHKTAMLSDQLPRKGQEVSYFLQQNMKGRKAVSIKIFNRNP